MFKVSSFKMKKRHFGLQQPLDAEDAKSAMCAAVAVVKG